MKNALKQYEARLKKLRTYKAPQSCICIVKMEGQSTRYYPGFGEACLGELEIRQALYGSSSRDCLMNRLPYVNTIKKAYQALRLLDFSPEDVKVLTYEIRSTPIHQPEPE